MGYWDDLEDEVNVIRYEDTEDFLIEREENWNADYEEAKNKKLFLMGKESDFLDAIFELEEKLLGAKNDLKHFVNWGKEKPEEQQPDDWKEE